jgi:hypothetical protein
VAVLDSARSAARLALSALLMMEALARGARLAQLLPALPGYDPLAVFLICASGVVAALQMTSGWLLAARRLPAVALARQAVVAGAVLNTLVIGAALAPTIVYPWWRWQVTAAYWVYALLAVMCISKCS